MTGDLGKIDEDGFLSIEGRIKDIIIRGGENISPKEIEELILKMGQVDNVQVIGVHDPKFQEEICAFVKVRKEHTLTKKEILEFLKPRIAHFKVPKYVNFVDTFPYTITGKPQKFEMKQIWEKEIKDLSKEEIAERFNLR